MWYKNISTLTVAVPIGNGNVAAVRPQCDVEVETETPALVRLKRQSKIVRTGRPQHLMAVSRPVAVRTEAERKPANTEFAQRVQERASAMSADEARRKSAMDAQSRAAEIIRNAERATPKEDDVADDAGLNAETGATMKRGKRDKARA